MALTFTTGALKIMLQFSQGTNIPSSLLFHRPHPLLPWQLWRQGTIPGLRWGPAWEASLWAESLSPVFPFLCPSLPLGFIGFQDCAQGLGVFPLPGDTSPAVTERGEEGTRQCGGHSAGSVGGCGSTQKGHYHMRTHTAEVWSKKAFWRTWSELSPKIGESYPWCPGSGSGATQHALEETGLRRWACRPRPS